MAIVTIARTSGSGGEEIGKAVAGELGYEYIGKNRILENVEVRGEQWLDWGKQLDEHAPSPWERFDRSYTGFVSLVEGAICRYALENNKVIMGRGGNWLLREIPYVLRVYITASAEERIRRISDREHVNIETARRMVEFSDNERTRYLRNAYHREGTNPEDYDMVFNTGSVSSEEVARQIVDEMSEREKRDTPEARGKLGRLAMEAYIRSAILTDPRIFVPTLEVVHDGTGIVVRGVVHSAQEQALVVEIARRFAESTPVRSALRFRGA